MQSVKIFGKNYDLKVVYSNIDTPELNIEENYEIKIILPNKSGRLIQPKTNLITFFTRSKTACSINSAAPPQISDASGTAAPRS